MKAAIGRSVLVAMLVVLSVMGAMRVSIAEGDVERRVADFWSRVDAMGPDGHLSSADLGQWALNMIERDSRARITVTDFRASTAAMQVAMDRARAIPGTAATPSAAVEQRIAEFWRRVEALSPGDYLSAADLGQWALNVIARDATARIAVADFRASTAPMQAGIDRAGPAPVAVLPRPTVRPVAPAASQATYEFQASIGADDRAAVADGIGRSDRYFGEALGGPVRHNFRVRVVREAIEGACCGASYGSIYINTNEQWQQRQFGELTSPSFAKQTVVAHEYTHVWQADRGCISGAFPEFVEGMAHYLGHQVLVRDGAFEDSLGHRFQVFAMKNGSSYGVAYAKVEFLVQRSSLGALAGFCESIGRGIAWSDAFAASFKTSYAQFSAAWDVRKIELLRTAAYPWPSAAPTSRPSPRAAPSPTPRPVPTGPLALGFERALQPGSLADAPPHLVPYLFRVSGVDWALLTRQEKEAAMQVPPGYSGWSGSRDGEDLMIILLEPGTPSGEYTFSLRLQGQTLSARFTHVQR